MHFELYNISDWIKILDVDELLEDPWELCVQEELSTLFSAMFLFRNFAEILFSSFN